MDIEALVGKPLTVLTQGKKREIGTILRAHTDQSGIFIHASVTDVGVRKLLGLRKIEGEVGLPDA